MEHVHTESSEQTSISTLAESAAAASTPLPEETEPSAPADEHERALIRETVLALQEGLEIALGAVGDLLVYLDIEPRAAGEGEGDEAEPRTDRTPLEVDTDVQNDEADLIAPLAIRTDGVALLHSKWLSKSVRKGRRVWKGIVLSALETAFVKNYFDNAAHEGASKLAPQMKRGK